MLPLSVVIITYNEEKNIERCLDSVKEIADEILVVDSFSTDKTEKICSSYKVRFIKKAWEGYSSTKNFANQQARYDWILSLDADEVLSEELKKSIAEIKKGAETKTYKFNRLTNYCGKWIKHGGWYPDTKVRIFDRRKTKWEGDIHETLTNINEKEISLLTGDCLHYSYYTIDEHLKQAEKFTDIAADSLFAKGEKATWLLIILKTVAKFIKDYFLKIGFLDGYFGFIISRISAKATFLKYYKLKKLNQKH